MTVTLIVGLGLTFRMTSFRVSQSVSVWRMTCLVISCRAELSSVSTSDACNAASGGYRSGVGSIANRGAYVLFLFTFLYH